MPRETYTPVGGLTAVWVWEPKDRNMATKCRFHISLGCLQTGTETLSDILGKLPKGRVFGWKKAQKAE